MSQMNTAQARVIDPILTAVARGYGSPNAKIANILFPLVTVGVRAGKILSFGPDSFKIVNSARAPGTNTKRINLGYASGDYALVDHRLEATVPVEVEEESAAVPGIDLAEMHINLVQDVMSNEREKQAADLARNPANYDATNKTALSGTAKWSDPGSDPFTDLNDAKEVIRGQIGKKPNVLEVGPRVLTALRNHPKILDRISITADRVPATIEQLQRLLEINLIVEGEATFLDESNKFQDMWGLDAVLAYTVPANMQQRGSPNYGYTYQLAGRPAVEEGYFGRNENSWYYPYADAYKAQLVGKSAGFLFQGAAA